MCLAWLSGKGSGQLVRIYGVFFRVYQENHHKCGIILMLVASSDMDCCSTSPDRRAGIKSKSKSDHFAFHSKTNRDGESELNVVSSLNL